MKKIILTAVTSVLSAAFLVANDDASVTKPCKDDAAKFCKEIKPGSGRVWSCLKGKESELSQPCKDAMMEAREKGKAFRKDCGADVKQFCKGVKHGQGRIAACLKANNDRLSEPCKAFFKNN